uniref:Uncharacterized protein n=1 Tax=Elaeophora elaphi TaxID=1147741 RepID=A0A0R3RWL1_9BILA
MWSTTTPLALTILISMMIIFSTSHAYALDGFGCCIFCNNMFCNFRAPCPPKAPSCNCPCGFPMLPQFPPMPPQLPSPLLPPPTFPQYSAYPSGGGGYATPYSSNARQQVVENGYLQEPSSYKIPPSISPNQPYQSIYQNMGAYGYNNFNSNLKQFEQTSGGASGGYATGPYGVENGNFGDYAAYGLPQNVQKESRFGELPQQVPASGAGQYITSAINHASQSDTPVAVTVGTYGTEYNSSPAGDYEKKTKAFLKVRKSQLA